MSDVVAKQSAEANTPLNIKNLHLIMIVDFKLIYPSGTATAHHINSFHTPQGAKLTKKQVRAFGKFFSLTDAQKGKWYSPDLSSSSFQGLQGYNAALSLVYTSIQDRDAFPVNDRSTPTTVTISYDDKRRTKLFLKDRIPSWIAVTGYVIIAIYSIVTVPHIFPQLKWYHILTMYIIAPVLAFCIAYANSPFSPSGLVSTASDLMQDFKIAERLAPLWAVSFLLASSGCSTKPFLTLVKPEQHILHLTRLVNRNMSILGVEGFSALPKHCLMLCYIFFAAAVFVNGLKDLVGPNWARFIPLPMAMAISFHIGGYFMISMCVGLYNFIKVLGRTVIGLYKQFKDRDAFPVNDRSTPTTITISYDDK
ncbi:hypothetical protein IGI04_023449 [Brassica rapa subsp. trilocularis]|uniref:Uncharacterized protein n=1 Tax=Brassica rapa subsp. trilocularis TaxID=1813537 RepID=A0ABQ7M830_BRACM|nr:hypothetical protein IGI04_023449 [Brassica rapa subsp. trilocularis]